MDILFGLALSTHLGLSNEYNEIHPHVRLQQDQFIAGAFYNSESKLSLYGGTRLETNDFGIENYSNFGLELGLTSGYDDFGIVPFARGTYSINENTQLFLAPAPEKNSVNEINLGAVFGTEFRF